MRELIGRSHESAKAKKAHTRRAWQLFRPLIDRKIIEFIPKTIQTPHGAKLRVNVDLQEDFSMNHALSLWIHDTLPLMDPNAPDFALVMEELEKLEYPKPNRDFVYSTFNAFADKHPWVGQEAIRPKSIAREMFEEFRSFADYIKLYDLQRAEGILLRHLSNVQKVLAQTVPDTAKNDTLREMEVYLATMLRQVDSSLLDEWEKMRDPSYQAVEQADMRPPGAEEALRDITRDPTAFLATIRVRIFAFLRGLITADYPEELEDWPAERLQSAMDCFLLDHDRICLDPEARNLRHTYVTPSEDKSSWQVQQMIIDPEGINDWVAEFQVDLPKSRETGQPALHLIKFGPLVE
jgi:hypothetical protein